MTAELRNDRDRYVGFAFAAADLLIELDRGGRILAASGAPQTVCGRERDDIVGSALADLVAPGDRPLVRRLITRIDELGRIDAVSVRIDHASGKPVRALLGGCRLPNITDRLFFTLTLLPLGVAAEDTRPRDRETGLLDRESLVAAATRQAVAGAAPVPRRLTLLRLEGLAGATRGLPAERAGALMDEIGAALRAESAGGDAAGRLGAEEFGLVAAPAGLADNGRRLEREIGAAARAAGLPDDALQTRVTALDLAVGGLDEREAATAIAYAVKSFAESQGAGFTLSSLRRGLGTAVESVAQRFGELRRSIADGGFTLVYQPIVTLPGRGVHHHEALARFPDGRDPFQTVIFGEAVGLIEELDLAVCRQAILALDRAPGARVAVNLSGRSVQSERFRMALTALVRPRRDLRGRLIFELTESAAVERVDEAAEFLRGLKSDGFAICLDDFGAGATAYHYLRHFDVDFVKIDGPFLRAANTAGRERALVRSICVLCRDLGSAVVGEMIEDEAALTEAVAMGIGLGQGWLFGKPVQVLPPADSPPQRAVRRRGAVEMWE